MSKLETAFVAGKSAELHGGGDDTGGLPTEVMLSPDGLVESTEGSFRMNAEAAGLIIEEFKARGVLAPIDYEHQSLGGKYASPSGKAPAAGWIDRIEYRAGEGLFGHVERWLPDARKEIAETGYRYLSPVFEVRKSDRLAVALHSAALTNVPAIPGMRRLAAKHGAEDAPDGTHTGETTMDGEATTETTTETTIDLIAILRELLEMPEATEEELVAALREKLVKKEEAEAPSEETQEAVAVASKVLAVLKLQPSTDAETVVTVLKSRLGGSKEATETIANLTRKVDSLEAGVRLQAGEKLFDELAVKTGRLHPESDAGKRWMKMACEQPEQFRAHIGDCAVLAPPGRTEAPKGGGGGKGDRATVIAKASREYDAGGTEGRLTDRVAFVNDALREGKLARLDDDESKKIGS